MAAHSLSQRLRSSSALSWFERLPWVAGTFLCCWSLVTLSPPVVEWEEWGCLDSYPAASALLILSSQVCTSFSSSMALRKPLTLHLGHYTTAQENKAGSTQERMASELGGKDATLSERTRYLSFGNCLQRGVSSQGDRNLQPDEISSPTRLLSIVWQVVSNCHISPCRLRLQWHFPALSCHGANVSAVTTGRDSLFA